MRWVVPLSISCLPGRVSLQLYRKLAVGLKVGFAVAIDRDSTRKKPTQWVGFFVSDIGMLGSGGAPPSPSCVVHDASDTGHGLTDIRVERLRRRPIDRHAAVARRWPFSGRRCSGRTGLRRRAPASAIVDARVAFVGRRAGGRVARAGKRRHRVAVQDREVLPSPVSAIWLALRAYTGAVVGLPTAVETARRWRRSRRGRPSRSRPGRKKIAHFALR